MAQASAHLPDNEHLDAALRTVVEYQQSYLAYAWSTSNRNMSSSASPR